MSSHGYDQYKSQRVATATPAELIGMLYDAAIVQLHTAREAIEAGRAGAGHPPLVKSQDIVTELRCALSFEHGGELAHKLDSIYDYVLRLLVRANVQRDVRAIGDAMRLLEPLRDAWREACLHSGAQTVAAATA